MASTDSSFDHDICHCEDCVNYRYYIKKQLQPCARPSFTAKGCRNDSFHETSVLTAIFESDVRPSLVEVQPFKDYPVTTSIPTRSVSTGDIPNATPNRYKQGVGKTSSDPGFPANPHQCSCFWPVSKNRPLLYVSFASDNKRHESEVVELCNMCDRAGFAVKCDSYRVLQEAGELNILQWRDVNFRSAACVLFCISPAYSDIIRSVEDEDMASAAESDHDKGVIYIYRQAQSELVDHYSMDRRFFIVLFSNSGSNLSVPLCFSPYAKFKFPEESTILVNAMKNRYQ